MPQVVDNRLLAALSGKDLDRLRPHLKLTSYPLGKSLHEAGVSLKHVHFPVSGIISLLHVMSNGASAEVAVIGREGMIGISSFMGADRTSYRAVVQGNAQAYSLPAAVLAEEFQRGASFQKHALHFTHVLIAQMAQTAACNRHHSVEQQMCRWLLMSLDRLPSNELAMTHELIANMLGVRREGVTECARKLQEAGVIRYSRGRITVLDRKKLQTQACECYAIVEKEYARLFL